MSRTVTNRTANHTLNRTHRPAWPEQPRGFDLLRLPGLRRFFRWRYARLTFQLPLLLLALFVVVDGLTGEQLAPRNIATTTIWLHYRGLVVVALALLGNAFCAACPLLLTRGLTRKLERFLPRKLVWPRVLKNKYLVTALLLLFFLSYELFDLWASPWLTAWLVIGYFAGVLAIDTLFPSGTFCRYVCPLGNFNFAFATASPTQIAAVNPDVCEGCRDKPCLHGRESYADSARAAGRAAFIPLSEIQNPNGQGHFPGCETDLMVPTIVSNMDCTFCTNCVRACPYDNVALRVRAPGLEWTRSPWLRRGGFAVILLGILLTCWGLLNAVAMIGPYYQGAQWLAATLGTRNEALLLTLIFAGVTLSGLALTTLMSLLADRLGGVRSAPVAALMRWGYVLLPLGFGFWAAHYLFHFLTGALSIVPVFQHFFKLWGFAVDPNWRLSRLVPTSTLFPIGAGLVSVYALLAVWVAFRIALCDSGRRDFGRRGALALWPPLLFILMFAALSLLVLAQPMEMRGTIFGPTF
jgi:polyferredoxin